MKQVAGWLVKDGRVPHNPLAHIEQRNARTDIRRRRRPLTPGECRLLLKATPLQPRREGLSGLERAWAYRIALETGLRLGEIKKLVKADFILSANPPTVTVRAAYSKHRREDIQPLPIRLAADLVAFLSGYPEDQPIFASFDHAPKALEADLKAVGIPYKDAAGRFADFHALRHTYISNLSLAGVPPKIAMDLARHSSIQLTMDFYSHTRLEECAAALKVLPELVAAAEQVTDETQDRNASSHVAKAEPLCPPAGTSDFDALTQAWPTLPEQVKAGIMALIQSTLQQQA